MQISPPNAKRRRTCGSIGGSEPRAPARESHQSGPLAAHKLAISQASWGFHWRAAALCCASRRLASCNHGDHGQPNRRRLSPPSSLSLALALALALCLVCVCLNFGVVCMQICERPARNSQAAPTVGPLGRHFLERSHTSHVWRPLRLSRSVAASETRPSNRGLEASAAAPLHKSRLKPRQVRTISRRRKPIRTSTAAGDESAHRSSTTRLMQSLYWNSELVVVWAIRLVSNCFL